MHSEWKLFLQLVTLQVMGFLSVISLLHDAQFLVAGERVRGIFFMGQFVWAGTKKCLFLKRYAMDTVAI